VIVSTSIGASDPRIVAACGLASDDELPLDQDTRPAERNEKKLGLLGAKKPDNIEKSARSNAPDGGPPLSFPFVIVDEACQSVEPATLIPLTASNSCRSLVLLGDPCQLPATVRSDPNSSLTISLMERLAATLPPPVSNGQVDTTDEDTKYLDGLPIKQARSLLRSLERGDDREDASYRKRFAGSLLLSVQYRMHPSISAFSSSMFYDGQLSTPSLLGRFRPFPKILQEIMPCGDPDMNVRFTDVGGRCNEMRGEHNRVSGNSVSFGQESTTYRNEAEAVKVVTLIKQILSARDQTDPFSPKSIGVITPYSGQVQLINSMIANDEEIQSHAKDPSSTIEVKSVDGFQGRERDVIIFSAVRSNRKGNVGFLRDWRRLNVAMTRARTALIVIGDMDTLVEGDKHWAAFGKWCQGVDCIIRVDDTKDPCE
jgi:superfamily I DNA and/or RNA helicase